jgi:alpha-1,2-mannosyltransferase
MEDRENLILSIGQFRPEKDHALQIKAFAKMRNIAEGRDQLTDFKLILVGSCRGKEDQDRVKILRELAESLNVTENVEFVLNQPFPVLKDFFGTASVGLHTMWNEHFGIGVVEMMAAGLITIAHNSGGPKADIIVPYSEKKLLTGYLASTEEEYANAMLDACIIGMNNEKSRILRQSAQESSQRFSDAIFNTSFKLLISKFCTAS